jgi:hypothetical protein
VGVTDAGEVVGWQHPGRGQLHDWMRNELREAIDPLPLYACRAVEYEGQSVVVIRIHPGDPPYVLRRSGSVYVREPGSKNPIGAQHRLLEFVRQNAETAASAAARLQLGEELGLLLRADSDPPEVPHFTHTVDWVLVGTPQVLPVNFATRALAGSSVTAATRRLAAVLERNTLHPRSQPPRPVAGSAFVIEGQSEPSGMFMRVVVTATGTVAATLSERLRRPAFHTGQIADIRIASLLNVVFGTLTDLGASGRGLFQLSMQTTPAAVNVPMITLGSANQGYAMTTGESFELNDELLLPVTDELIGETAERMMRAFARANGIPYWEPEATPD